MATFSDSQVKDVIFYNDRMYHLIDGDSCFFCRFCQVDKDCHSVCYRPEDFPTNCVSGKIFERIYL